MSTSPQPSPAAPPTPERIMQFVWGYAPTFMLETAVQIGLFDLLQRSPSGVAAAAGALRQSERGMRMLMEGLAGLGFLERDAQGVYRNGGEAAAFLVSDSPASLAGLVGHVSSHHLPTWMRLAEAVRTGVPPRHVNRQVEGTAFFHELVSDIFPMSFMAARALREHLGLERATAPVRVLDLAAGSGVWGIAAALGAPAVQVTAVDWPGMEAVWRRHVERMGVAGQARFVAGDIGDADFGTGHDLAILGHILHSEGPERSRRLLARTAAALRPGATIAIAEFLVDADRGGPMNGLVFALNMLVNTDHGDTYSAEQIAGWLREAGFGPVRSLPAPGPSPLLLATRL